MFQTKKVISGVLLFSITYLVCLLLWVQLKPYYGAFITRSGTECAALFSSFRLDSFRHDSENATITFSRMIYTSKGLGDLAIDVNLKVSNYSFNIPLTIALIAALLPIIQWNGKQMVEAILLLVTIHFTYVFFYTALQLFYYSHPVSDAIRSYPTIAKQYFLEFMWAFIDNMVVRFEPFLLALYLFFRQWNKMPFQKESKQ